MHQCSCVFHLGDVTSALLKPHLPPNNRNPASVTVTGEVCVFVCGHALLSYYIFMEPPLVVLFDPFVGTKLLDPTRLMAEGVA